MNSAVKLIRSGFDRAQVVTGIILVIVAGENREVDPNNNVPLEDAPCQFLEFDFCLSTKRGKPLLGIQHRVVDAAPFVRAMEIDRSRPWC